MFKAALPTGSVFEQIRMIRRKLNFEESKIKNANFVNDLKSPGAVLLKYKMQRRDLSHTTPRVLMPLHNEQQYATWHEQ